MKNHPNIINELITLLTSGVKFNGLKIANLDVTHEEKMIKKYQKRLQQQPLQRHTKNLLELGR